MPITLKTPQEIAQLLKFGEVYIFRSSQINANGNDWATKTVNGEKICEITVDPIGYVNTPDALLKKYCGASGYLDLTDWLNNIKEQYPTMDGVHGFFYRITRIGNKYHEPAEISCFECSICGDLTRMTDENVCNLCGKSICEDCLGEVPEDDDEHDCICSECEDYL